MLRSTLILSVLLLVVNTVTAREKWHRSQMKDPQKDIDECGRYQVSMICDPNNILEPRDADQLDDLITHVMNTTKCPCAEYFCDKDNRGYRIAVALVPEMITDAELKKEDDNEMSESDKITSKLNEASKFAYQMLTNWEPGQCEEAVIIFYSMRDNVLYTVTGKTARDKLKNNMVGQIAIDYREYFSPDGKGVFTGLRNIIVDYHKVFDGQYEERKMGELKPNDPQAVVGSGAYTSLTSVFVLCVSALLSFLMLC